MSWNGTYYRKYASMQREIGHTFIDIIPFLGNERVLDIGCGDGFNTNYLLGKLPKGEIIGIDISDSMLESAKEFIQPQLSFLKSDAQNFNFDEPFDIIVSMLAIHWISNKQKMLENVAKSLKLGGKFYFLFTLIDDEPALLKSSRIVQMSNKWKSKVPSDFNEFPVTTVDEFNQQVKNSNLTIEYQDRVFYRKVFPNRYELKQWLYMALKVLELLDPDDRSEYLDDVLDHHESLMVDITLYVINGSK